MVSRKGDRCSFRDLHTHILLGRAKVCMYVFVCMGVYLEVIHGDSQGVEQVSIDGFVLQVYEGHLLADGLQSSF